MKTPTATIKPEATSLPAADVESTPTVQPASMPQILAEVQRDSLLAPEEFLDEIVASGGGE